MKKLLTVLLAAAMVLTYSVPAVFADTITQADIANQANAKAQSEMSNVNAAKTLYLNGVTYTKNTDSTSLDYGVEYAEFALGGTTYTLSKAAVEAIAADVVANAQTDVNAAQVSVINSNVTDSASLAVQLALITAAASPYYTSNGFATKVAAKVTASGDSYEFAASKARYLAAINAVDPTKYSTTVVTTAVPAEGLAVGDSRQSKVAGLKADALTAFNAATTNTTAKAKKVATDFLSAVGLIQTSAQEAAATQNLATVKANAVKDLTNYADNAYRAEKKILEDTIANASTSAADKATAQTKLNALKANIDSIVAMKTTQINAATTTTEVTAIAIVDTTATANTLNDAIYGITAQGAVTAKDAIAQAVKDQAALDKMTTIDGITLKYQDGAVDEALAATLVKVYDGTYTSSTAALQAMASALATKTNDQLVTQKKSVAKTISDTDLSVYDETRAAEAQKLIDEYVAKVNAATTSKDVTDAKAAFDAALAKVTTIAQHNTMIASSPAGSLYTEYVNKYKAMLDAYVDYYYTTHTVATPARDAVQAAVQAYMLKAYTTDEMATRVAGAKSLVDNLKTDAALKSAAADVVTAINAIDKNVTLASKANIVAAGNAMDSYLENPGTAQTDVSNYSVLIAAKATLKALENANVNTLANAIATATDKAAAVKAATDAYNQYVKDYPTSKSDLTVAKATIDAAQTALDKADAAAVSDMIGKLPAADKVTAADADAINAAAKAYDALDDAAKTLVTDVNKAKLDLCQKALSAAIAAQAKLVQSYKITASSKAYKGKMIIKWTVKGTAVTGVKYQVWRSTSKNTGFKKMFTTSAKKYTNTKNLKPGKVYYYKVRAFVTVDGVKYFSDWSNKAFRTAK